MKRAIVIGAGLGGLSCAIRLAAGGYAVTVLERQASAGGKLQRIVQDGYTFDRGPSTITMPDLFERVFTAAGRRMEDYLSFYPLDPLARNRFADGHEVVLTRDATAVAGQIAAFSPADASRYGDFLQEAARLYRLSRDHFLDRLLLTARDKLSPNVAAGFARIRPFTPLQRLLRRYFRHPNTLAMFGRYATYVGSSPYEAPAVFAMLAHVEASVGIYGVRGGTYAIVAAFERLARELGADIRTGAEVRRIVVDRNGRAAGVETYAGLQAADLVVVNADVLTAYRELLAPQERPSMPDRRIAGYEPSLSGFVLLAGVAKRFDALQHHNVFFPARYEEEFRDIFQKRRLPADPTLYVCWSGHDEPGMAPPGGSNLFILANAPYVTDRSFGQQTEENGRLADRLLHKLEADAGLTGLQRSLKTLSVYTPSDLEADTRAHRGAIYGISSNSARQTFARPSNQSRDIEGLWFVGGTTHPGGGTPIVTLSGQLVAERILRTT